MVVAPKGPSYVYSPWEVLDRARRRDVYTGLVPKGLVSFGGSWGGGHPIPGKPAIKVVHGARVLTPARAPVWVCVWVWVWVMGVSVCLHACVDVHTGCKGGKAKIYSGIVPMQSQTYLPPT